MKFGTAVKLFRGSRTRTSGPGFGRVVRGTLIGARGWQVRVRLDQDDPDALVGPTLKGETGWWSQSAVSLG